MKSPAILWYAMRVPYSRELLFKNHLDSLMIENFIPMHYQLIEKHGTKARRLVPVIHNLIFVRSSKMMLDNVKSNIESKIPARYIMDRSIKRPLTIPDNQMEDFITISKSNSDKIVYLDPTDAKLKKGDRVRIIDGSFAGIEGEFLASRATDE